MTTTQYVRALSGRDRTRKTYLVPGMYAAAAGKATVTPEGALFTDAKGYDLAYVWPDDRVRWMPGGQAVVRARVGM